MKRMLTLTPFLLMAETAGPGAGGTKPNKVDTPAPVKFATPRAELESIMKDLGIVLMPNTGPQFAMRLGDVKPVESGDNKGWTKQRVADCTLTLISGVPFTGLSLAVARDTQGRAATEVWLPSNGPSNKGGRSIINVTGSGTRKQPQYVEASAAMDRVSAILADEGKAWLLAEAAAGRGIAQRSKAGAVPTQSAMSPDEAAAMGF